MVFLDTETTGLAGLPQDKIVEIAIVNYDGEVLLDTLINPERPIGFTTAIHGITDEMVQSAPTFEECWDNIKDILTGEHIVIFNSAFDTRFFPDQLRCAGQISCAMVGFQRAYRADGGTSNKYNLRFATEYIGYAWEGSHHRALADTFAARAVWLWIEKIIREHNLLKITPYGTETPRPEIPQDPILRFDFHLINRNNQLVVELRDFVFLNADPENNPTPLDDPIEISDNEDNDISIDKLIGKRCGDIVQDFNCYGVLFTIQIANIQRPGLGEKDCKFN